MTTDRVSVVTGAAGGIGSAIVRRLRERGDTVFAVDLTLPRVTEADEDLHWIATDLSDPQAAAAVLEQVWRATGRVDVLVNNAGIEGPTSPLWDLSLEDFDRVMNINLRAAFVLTGTALRLMGQGPGGAIVNVASIAGLRASVGVPAYVVSKHALVGLTRAAAKEAPAMGVRVNAVCPGPIDTQMMTSIEEGLAPEDPGANRRVREARIPMGRYGTVDEVARTVRWLASDDAAFVNGACIVVDGGSTA